MPDQPEAEQSVEPAESASTTSSSSPAVVRHPGRSDDEVLPTRSSDEYDRGWGDDRVDRGDRDDDWYLRERPPHH
jgi:hypothetical protein